MATISVLCLIAGSLLLAAKQSRAAESPSPEREAISDEWRLGSLRRLDLAVELGVNRRVGSPDFPLETATSLAGGIEARAFLARRFAIAASWERLGLGREETGITSSGTAGIDRSADAGWLMLRLDPLASARVAAFVELGAGLAVQRASAVGLGWSPTQPGLSQPFACSGSSSVAPGFRLDLGAEALLAAGVRFFMAASAEVLGFGDGPLGDCVAGAGSAQLITGRAGLSYSFDFERQDARHGGR